MFVVDNGLTHLTAGSRVANVSRRREWVFGYFGQINPFKGVDILLDAAELLRKERVSNTRIRIHGNLIGQSEQFCERLRDARAHGRVEYSGPYDYRAVTKLMSECDYVVVPSRWWENSPVVIQEAFAAGCPVICTGIGGMAEKVKPGVSGLHFRLGDAADLARCMIDAASDGSHRRLTKGLPKPFGALEMARRYLEVFSTTTRTPAKDVILENGEVQAVDFV